MELRKAHRRCRQRRIRTLLCRRSSSRWVHRSFNTSRSEKRTNDGKLRCSRVGKHEWQGRVEIGGGSFSLREKVGHPEMAGPDEGINFRVIVSLTRRLAAPSP